MRVGSYRIRLARLLNAAFPTMRNTPVTWTPEAIYPALGIWRQKRMDVQLWNASALDAAGRVVAHVGCWETMGDCLKAGWLELSDDGETVSPTSKP